MANGDDAAAAGMAVLNGTEDRRNGWDQINLTRDYIAQRTSTVTPIAKGGTGQTTVAAARNAFGLGNTAGALPLANGGTGSTTAAAARTALGAASQAALDTVANDVSAATSGASPNQLIRRNASGQIGVTEPTAASHPATKQYVDTHQWDAGDIVSGSFNRGTFNTAISSSGTITATGRLRSPGSRGFVVSSDYVSAYIDGDGWIGYAPSAERLKQDITPQTYTLEQLMLIQVVAYRLKTAVESDPDAAGEVGVIAEQLLAAGLSEFVVFNAAGETQSVAYERLVLVTIGAMQDMASRLDQFDGRLAALERASK